MMSGVSAIQASQSKSNGGKQAAERRPVATAAAHGHIRVIVVRLTASAFNDSYDGLVPFGDVLQALRRHANRAHKRR